MKKFLLLMLPVCWLINLTPLTAQKEFSSCTAAFLDWSMIVNDYAPNVKCAVPATAQGTLTVRPVALNDGQEAGAGEAIPFRIALRDAVSRTLTSFSDMIYREIDLPQVLSRCKKGDAIILITTDRKWSLPHCEIAVE